MSLIANASVEGFFREVLLESLERQGISATENTEHYLVGLLGNYTNARISDEPLSVKLARAHDDPAERVKALKEVGDTSLYITGFFRESLESSLVQADYYKSLGAAAYGELAGRLGRSSVREVYEELAAEFPRFVDVLVEVRGQVNFAGADVTQLYQQWLSTRSEWIEERLRNLGVLVSVDGDDYLQ